METLVIQTLVAENSERKKTKQNNILELSGLRFHPLSDFTPGCQDCRHQQMHMRQRGVTMPRTTYQVLLSLIGHGFFSLASVRWGL